MKSNKIESLPEDLKQVANQLVDNKFPDNKRYRHTSSSTIKFAPDIDSLAFVKSQRVEDLAVTYDIPKKSSMDSRLEEFLRSFERGSFPYDMAARVVIRFKPVGEIDMGSYYAFRQHNEVMQFEIRSKQTGDPIERVADRLRELESYYNGYFVAIMDRYEINKFDGYNGLYI